jgi:hypothetical protein
VSGSHTYTQADDYTITVTITDVDTSHDSGGSQATALTPVEVDAGTMTATGVTASSVEGQTFNGVVASFSDSDPYATPSLFTATIDWGDGTSSSVGSAGISANNQGGFDVTASHTYTDENTYTATITIYDNDVAGAEVTSSVVVGDAPLTGINGSLYGAPTNVAAGNTPDSIGTLQLDNGEQVILVANFNGSNVSLIETDGTNYTNLGTLRPGRVPTASRWVISGTAIRISRSRITPRTRSRSIWGMGPARSARCRTCRPAPGRRTKWPWPTSTATAMLTW